MKKKKAVVARTGGKCPADIPPCLSRQTHGFAVFNIPDAAKERELLRVWMDCQ